MGEMKITISNSAEMLFRKIAMQRFGYQKGAMSEAAQEAFVEWADSNIETSNQINPVDEIFKMGKKSKKSSVELQHEAWHGVCEKHAY